MVDSELAKKSVGELWNVVEELEEERDRYREALKACKEEAWSYFTVAYCDESDEFLDERKRELDEKYPTGKE